MRVAVIGAGVAGLVAARAMLDGGHETTVFEKGRGVGGRLATRRAEQGGFDHGAQRFTARTPSFRAELEAWEREGLAAPTEPATDEPWWIPVPTMNTLAKALAVGLTVRTSARVTSLRRVRHAFRLAIEGGEERGPFDVVLVTAPAPQAAALLHPYGPIATALGSVRYDPTWAVLLLADAEHVSWPERIFTEAEAGSPLSLIVREGKKPGRTPDGSLVRLVVHASTEFSRAHLEESEDVVLARLMAALRLRPGLQGIVPRFAQAHRWRYARVANALQVPYLFDRERGLGVAGDGLLGPRIEAAFESGRALADAVMQRG